MLALRKLTRTKSNCAHRFKQRDSLVTTALLSGLRVGSGGPSIRHHRCRYRGDVTLALQPSEACAAVSRRSLPRCRCEAPPNAGKGSAGQGVTVLVGSFFTQMVPGHLARPWCVEGACRAMAQRP